MADANNRSVLEYFWGWESISTQSYSKVTPARLSMNNI